MFFGCLPCCGGVPNFCGGGQPKIEQISATGQFSFQIGQRSGMYYPPPLQIKYQTQSFTLPSASHTFNFSFTHGVGAFGYFISGPSFSFSQPETSLSDPPGTITKTARLEIATSFFGTGLTINSRPEILFGLTFLGPSNTRSTYGFLEDSAGISMWYAPCYGTPSQELVEWRATHDSSAVTYSQSSVLATAFNGRLGSGAVNGFLGAEPDASLAGFGTPTEPLTILSSFRSPAVGGIGDTLGLGQHDITTELTITDLTLTLPDGSLFPYFPYGFSNWL